MRRYPSPYVSSFSFGPGPLSTALKALIGANVVVFVGQIFFPIITDVLGLQPYFVTRHLWVWQIATYMFLHGGLFHILFNMLALWMFGTELERTRGTRYFLKFYFVTGVGAGLLTVFFSLLPFGFAQQLYRSNIIGASGAIYGLLHLGGLLVGYLYLKSARVHPLSELKYRYLKWKINRVRKKFDVYSGGRGADDWDRRVH
jgi:membrane associated rhomboid family serine protease